MDAIRKLLVRTGGDQMPQEIMEIKLMGLETIKGDVRMLTKYLENQFDLDADRALTLATIIEFYLKYEDDSQSKKEFPDAKVTGDGIGTHGGTEGKDDDGGTDGDKSETGDADGANEDDDANGQTAGKDDNGLDGGTDCYEEGNGDDDGNENGESTGKNYDGGTGGTNDDEDDDENEKADVKDGNADADGCDNDDDEAAGEKGGDNEYAEGDDNTESDNIQEKSNELVMKVDDKDDSGAGGEEVYESIDDDNKELQIHEGPVSGDALIEPPIKKMKVMQSEIGDFNEQRRLLLMRQKKLGPLIHLSFAERLRRNHYERELKRLARRPCPLSKKSHIKGKLNASKLKNLRIPSSKLPAGKEIIRVRLHHSNTNFYKWRNLTHAIQIGKVSRGWKIPEHYPCLSRKDCRMVTLGLGPVVKPIPIRDFSSEKKGERVFGCGLRCAYCFQIIGSKTRLLHLAKCPMLPQDSYVRKLELLESPKATKFGARDHTFELTYIPCPGYNEVTWYKPLDKIHPCPMCGIKIIWNMECLQMHLDRVCQGLSHRVCSIKNDYKYIETFVGLGGRCDQNGEMVHVKDPGPIPEIQKKKRGRPRKMVLPTPTPSNSASIEVKAGCSRWIPYTEAISREEERAFQEIAMMEKEIDQEVEKDKTDGEDDKEKDKKGN